MHGHAYANYQPITEAKKAFYEIFFKQVKKFYSGGDLEQNLNKLSFLKHSAYGNVNDLCLTCCQPSGVRGASKYSGDKYAL